MRTVSIPREQIFQGPLVLVNRAHPLHEKERSALTSVDPHHPDILLESRARQLLSACIQKAGGQREIVPVSGGRSRAIGSSAVYRKSGPAGVKQTLGRS